MSQNMRNRSSESKVGYRVTANKTRRNRHDLYYSHNTAIQEQKAISAITKIAFFTPKHESSVTTCSLNVIAK
ncbi:hypothetical protein XELAEV_18001877mg [Xenopus laevis]|uniref:Uncharacterized protein n=1 Tax=Xenopus laevis TaxID=8355 RepID=A0A974GYG3_XENLA|nr:hypothetical protein XELAEV_18001877mg [Xenopus laevis]